MKKFNAEKFHNKLQQLCTANDIHAFQNKCLVDYPQHAEFIQNCVTKALNDCVVCMHKHKDYQDRFGYKHPTLLALYYLFAGIVGLAVILGFIQTI